MRVIKIQQRLNGLNDYDPLIVSRNHDDHDQNVIDLVNNSLRR